MGLDIPSKIRLSAGPGNPTNNIFDRVVIFSLQDGIGEPVEKLACTMLGGDLLLILFESNLLRFVIGNDGIAHVDVPSSLLMVSS